MSVPSERGRHGADGPVAAERTDDVDAALQRLLGLSDAGVLLGRLDEDRFTPAVVGADLGDLLLDVGEVVELDGVDDDAETA